MISSGAMEVARVAVLLGGFMMQRLKGQTCCCCGKSLDE